MQLHDQVKQRFNPHFGLGGALRVTHDAEHWLKSNLNISVTEMKQINQSDMAAPLRVQSAKQGLNRYGSMRPEDLKRKSWQLNKNDGGLALNEKNKQLFDR